ncbi:hypothetical protein LPJ61_005141 [Coemansia biformis]|uniref:Mis18 domain-containing protein n=1 Tax=Coemansia biformis TaxID=1286918 RepID=A0A9W7Y7B0_9FUNG|nr:hypothetical protein LPJ61_005141 [Coemansia biformis]
MERLRGDYLESGCEAGNGAAGAPDGGSSSDSAINGPVVFSCAKCRTILGDTFAYAASAPERNLFALHAVPESVSCGKTRKTSTARGEAGSAYFELSCAECDAVVGRRYVTTTPDIDVMRNTYALDIEKVVTYELGRCMDSRPPAADGPPPEFYTSVAFHEGLTLVKSNVAAIAAKLQQLEQAMARHPAPSPRSAAPAARKRPPQGLNPEIYHADASKRFGR